MTGLQRPGSLAFAAWAEGGDASTTQAARHATQARALVTGAAQMDGSHSQLIARLVETCADDTLRLTGQTGTGGTARPHPAGRTSGEGTDVPDDYRKDPEAISGRPGERQVTQQNGAGPPHRTDRVTS